MGRKLREMIGKGGSLYLIEVRAQGCRTLAMQKGDADGCGSAVQRPTATGSKMQLQQGRDPVARMRNSAVAAEPAATLARCQFDSSPG